jgi:hypothetical protein
MSARSRSQDPLADAAARLFRGDQRRAYRSFEEAFYNAWGVEGGAAEVLRRGRMLRGHVDDSHAKRWDRLLDGLEYRLARPPATSPAPAPAPAPASVNEHAIVYARHARQLFTFVFLFIVAASLGGLLFDAASRRAHHQEWAAAVALLIGASPFLTFALMMPVACIRMLRFRGWTRTISTTGEETPAVMTISVKPFEPTSAGDLGPAIAGFILDTLVGRFDEVTATVTGATLPQNGLVIPLAPGQQLPENPSDEHAVTLRGTPRKGELVVIRCGDLTLWPGSWTQAGPQPDKPRTRLGTLNDHARTRLRILWDTTTTRLTPIARRIVDRIFGKT